MCPPSRELTHPTFQKRKNIFKGDLERVSVRVISIWNDVGRFCMGNREQNLEHYHSSGTIQRIIFIDSLILANVLKTARAIRWNQRLSCEVHVYSVCFQWELEQHPVQCLSIGNILTYFFAQHGNHHEWSMVKLDTHLSWYIPSKRLVFYFTLVYKNVFIHFPNYCGWFRNPVNSLTSWGEGSWNIPLFTGFFVEKSQEFISPLIKPEKSETIQQYLATDRPWIACGLDVPDITSLMNEGMDDGEGWW